MFEKQLNNKYVKSAIILFGTLFLFLFIDAIIYGISYDELTTTGSAILTVFILHHIYNCLLYTSPSPRDGLLSRMPSSA